MDIIAYVELGKTIEKNAAPATNTLWGQTKRFFRDYIPNMTGSKVKRLNSKTPEIIKALEKTHGNLDGIMDVNPADFYSSAMRGSNVFDGSMNAEGKFKAYKYLSRHRRNIDNAAVQKSVARAATGTIAGTAAVGGIGIGLYSKNKKEKKV